MSNRMKFIWDWKKMIICFIAVFGMGFFLSFLILCHLGTDPCTFMNRSVAAKTGLSFGTWQLTINVILFLFVLVWKRSLIGSGTIFNMVLVGYYADFFDWIWDRWIPEDVFTAPVSRWCIFLVTLAGFIISVAVYINAQMGVAPYDAIPLIAAEKVKKRFPGFPDAVIRITWDGLAILTGVLAGGVPIIGIILMAFFLGPVISFVGRIFKKPHKIEI